ncbi:hypothetical protein [uncultured Nevskia sp.]|uniref:hypothetical protein n=1 Tax=uncultured Nevskia sp. TaxID=228950 RepID=UPI0025D2235E|nr:hypothetical protein [uncultured Nevskia sp.]
MSILNTWRSAAISFAVTSLLTLSVAHADSDQRDSGEAHVSSHESQRSEAAPNTWVQTKYFWLQHTTDCEAASSTVTAPVQKAASISAWKVAKYPAFQVTDRAAIAPAAVGSDSSADSENDWLRSKQAYRYATAPAQRVAELICAR